MRTPLEVLIEARSLVERPQWWTRGVCARDRDGYQVNPSSERAYCWCVYGALICAAAGYGPILSEAVRIFDCVVDGRLTLFNDGSEHDEVLAKFDEAIALAKTVGA